MLKSSVDNVVREPKPEKPAAPSEARLRACDPEDSQPKTRDAKRGGATKKKSMEELLDEAAEKGARKLQQLQWMERSVNHYRAMEDLLRAYKKSRQWEEHPEDYGFFPTGKSKDISVAPPPGLGLRDKVEMNELFVQSKEKSFIRSLARFSEVEAVVRLFESRPEFIIIRMYYFGEDENGQDRGPGAKPYTFPEISEALKNIGIEWAEKAVRRRRTKLVQDMTVMMFGVDGALSVESREPKPSVKDKSETGKEDNLDG